MSTVRRSSLAEQAAGLILERIRGNEWEVGAKLPGETTLAAQIGVGRSTVREAIRVLAAQGVLVTRQGAGVFLAAGDVSPGWEATLRRADVVAVLEARTAIEVEAAALAAQRHTPDELAALREALIERGRHRDDIAQHLDADAAFHRSVVSAAHSPVLLELFEGFEPRSREAMADLLRMRTVGPGGAAGPDPSDHEEHERVFEAIREGDAARAAAETREHLTRLRGLLS